jgi:hypothetical protein
MVWWWGDVGRETQAAWDEMCSSLSPGREKGRERRGFDCLEHGRKKHEDKKRFYVGDWILTSHIIRREEKRKAKI